MAKAKKKPKPSAPPKRAAFAKAKPKSTKPIAAAKKSARAGKGAKVKPSKPVKAASEKKVAAPARPVELRKPTLPGTLKLVPKAREASVPAREAADPADPVPSGIFRLVPKPVEASKAPAKTLRLVESDESSQTADAGSRAVKTIKAAPE